MIPCLLRIAAVGFFALKSYCKGTVQGRSPVHRCGGTPPEFQDFLEISKFWPFRHPHMDTVVRQYCSARCTLLSV